MPGSKVSTNICYCPFAATLAMKEEYNKEEFKLSYMENNRKKNSHLSLNFISRLLWFLSSVVVVVVVVVPTVAVVVGCSE